MIDYMVNNEKNCSEIPANRKMGILSKNFDKINKLISIEFDKELAPVDFTKLSIKLKNEKILPVDPKISQTRFISFFLSLEETTTGETLEITTPQGEVITTKDKSLIFNTYSITLPIDYIKSSMLPIISNGSQGAQIATNGVVSVLLFVSFNTAVVIIKLMQMLDYFQVLNIEFPSNLQAFMSFSDSNIFDIFPNVFYSKSAEEDCRVHKKLRENEIDCTGLNNVGHFVSQLLIILALKAFFVGMVLILKALKLTDKSKRGKVASLVLWANSKTDIFFFW